MRKIVGDELSFGDETLGGGGMPANPASSDIGLGNTTFSITSLDNTTTAGSRFVFMPEANKGSADTTSAFPNMAISNEGFSADASSAPSPALTKSFAGPTEAQSLFFFPPDPNMAVGPSNVVVTLNDAIAWYDKNGNQQSLQSLDTFFGNTHSNKLFDPRVIYDQYSGHFFAIADDVEFGTNRVPGIFIAESNTSDPSQGWTKFGFLANVDDINTGQHYFADYPTLAVDQNAIYITGIYFPFNGDEEQDAPQPDGVAGGSSTRLFILSKNLASPSIKFYDPEKAVGLDNLILQPAHTYGDQSGFGLSGSFLVTYQQNNSGGDTLDVIKINNASSSASFVNTAINVGNISDVSLTGSENFAPQLGSATGLNVGDDRVYSAVWRDGILYATTEIVVSGRAMVHWFEVNTSTMTLIDQGNITADDLGAGTNTYYGNITVNSSGQFAVGFSASNSSIFAGAYYAIHSSGDPAGTMEGTQALQVGQNSYFATGQFDSRNRWGDYSGAAVDPSDDKSFWFFNEYASSTQNQWATRIGEAVSDTTSPSLVHEGSITLAVGATATIPSSQLQFDDNVSSHAQETYSIVTAPAHGTLLKNGSATSSFTQADIDSGLIAYREDGSVASSDSFIFKVTDAAGNQTTAQQFQFQISPQPDKTAPSLVHEGSITLAVGARATIPSSQLQFDDNVSTHAQETYTVITGPTYGALLKSGSNTSSFTQADIDNGLISYSENGSVVSSDSFTFRVTDAAGNQTTTQQFQFQISPPPDRTAPSLVHEGSITLAVGATATIPSSQLQFDDNVSTHAQETYTIVTAPAHGTLLKNGSATSSFTQADIDNGLITYREDGSANSSDSFIFKVTDAAGNQTTAQQFQFQISQSDRTAPSLVHDGSITVAVGGTATIPSSELQFDDNVSTHAQEIYSVTSGPVHGALLKNGAPVSSFTQADIDNGLISYREDGSPATSDAFFFKVADAAGNTFATSFQFNITHIAPTVNVHDVSVATNASIAASSLVTSVSDPSGDLITQYVFFDSGAGGGHFTVNGVVQPAGQNIYVDFSDAANAEYVGGATAGSETLYVAVYDYTTNSYSNFSSLIATTTNNNDLQFGQQTFRLSAFGSNAGGWSSEDRFPRELADVNGDGMADIVGFGAAGVYVSLATGGGSFGPLTPRLEQFGVTAGGWSSQDRFPRELADVNGDGMADIVGFGAAGVYVSLATGGGSFGPLTPRLEQFGVTAGGWSSQDRFPRELADVNGDGMADIVGFGAAGVYVSLATGGGSFGPLTPRLEQFGVTAGGWSSQDRFPRELADVNGDHMADIVGFGAAGVYVSLATGGGSFGPLTPRLAQFGVTAGGWSSQDRFPRELADINGDGKVDIAGFGAAGVYLALGNGDGSFRPLAADLQQFGVEAGGWTSEDRFPRLLADVNHDGAADIVGFGAAGVYEALSHHFHLI